jgi:hypothetical protein
VLKRDGTVLTFGDNSRGQLANGVFTFRAVPSAVAGLSGVTRDHQRYAYSLALTGDGRVFGWGDNLSNQFGDDSVARLVAGADPAAHRRHRDLRGRLPHAWRSWPRHAARLRQQLSRPHRTGDESSVTISVPVPGLTGVRQCPPAAATRSR